MKSKHLILLLLVPLSEIKALFYSSDLKVQTSFFSQEKRFLCNVVEDYSNTLIFGIIFYFFTFTVIDKKSKQICFFLFILNALDLAHLAFLDLQYFLTLKLLASYTIYKICTTLKIFSTA